MNILLKSIGLIAINSCISLSTTLAMEPKKAPALYHTVRINGTYQSIPQEINDELAKKLQLQEDQLQKIHREMDKISAMGQKQPAPVTAIIMDEPSQKKQTNCNPVRSRNVQPSASRTREQQMKKQRHDLNVAAWRNSFKPQETAPAPVNFKKKNNK